MQLKDTQKDPREGNKQIYKMDTSCKIPILLQTLALPGWEIPGKLFNLSSVNLLIFKDFIYYVIIEDSNKIIYLKDLATRKCSININKYNQTVLIKSPDSIDVTGIPISLLAFSNGIFLLDSFFINDSISI